MEISVFEIRGNRHLLSHLPYPYVHVCTCPHSKQLGFTRDWSLTSVVAGHYGRNDGSTGGNATSCRRLCGRQCAELLIMRVEMIIVGAWREWTDAISYYDERRTAMHSSVSRATGRQLNSRRRRHSARCDHTAEGILNYGGWLAARGWISIAAGNDTLRHNRWSAEFIRVDR